MRNALQTVKYNSQDSITSGSQNESKALEYQCLLYADEMVQGGHLPLVNI